MQCHGRIRISTVHRGKYTNSFLSDAGNRRIGPMVISRVPRIVVIDYRKRMPEARQHFREDLELVYRLRQVINFVNDKNIQIELVKGRRK